MTVIQLNLLGTFEVRFDGEPITGFQTDKVRALLAYLALEESKDHSRQALAALLWPESAAPQAGASMRNTLARLRRALDAAGGGVSERLLYVTRRTIRFQHSEVLIDAGLFDAYLKAGFHSMAGDTPRSDVSHVDLVEALALYRGELLNDLNLRDAPAFDEWLRVRREGYARQAGQTMSQLVEALLAAGDYPSAEQYTVRLLELDPYHEAAHRQRMRLLALRGQTSEALAHFNQVSDFLQVELGVQPDPKTRDLAEEIRQGLLAPPQSQAPPANVVDNPPEDHAAVFLNTQEKLVGVPAPGVFFGRREETARVQAWLTHEGCRVVSIMGMGGTGKSTLAARIAHTLTDDYDVISWLSFLNAPRLSEVLPRLLQSLSDHQLDSLPADLNAQLSLLLVYLRDQSVLLILDNLESLLDEEESGQFRTGYEPYEQLLRWVAVQSHSSQFLLTSRELPNAIAQLANDLPQVRSLFLEGLDTETGSELLAFRRFQGTPVQAAELVRRYSGNPLALKIVADTVNELFAGDVAEILDQETLFFDDIRRVLDQQFERLPQLEQDVLYGLAVARETTSLQGIREFLLHPPRQSRLVQALRSLHRRSLIEQRDMDHAESGVGWGLQNVITEYLTNRLIETISDELIAEDLHLLHRHALLKAQSKDGVRHNQARLILMPIIRHLLAHFGHSGLSVQLLALVEQLRSGTGRRPSFAGGSLLNMMLQADLDLTGADFSEVCLWQADLQDRTLAGVNLSRSDLVNAAFTQTFGRVEALAVNPDGRLLAGGGDRGEVRLYDLETYQPIMYLPAHNNTVTSLCFNPDGRLLASTGHDEPVKLWDVKTGQLSSTLEGEYGVKSVQFSPDGALLAVAGHGGRAAVWRVKTGHCSAILQGDSSRVWTLAFHPLGNRLATAGDDGKILLWDVPEAWRSNDPTDDDRSSGDNLKPAKSAQIINFDGNADGTGSAITSLAFSHDGALLAAGMHDGSVRVGRTTGEDRWLPFHGHRDVVNSVAFDPVRGILASGSGDGAIRLWNVATGRCSDVLEGHRLMVWATAFTPDGRRLASGSGDGTIRLWQMLPRGEATALQTLHGYDRGLEAIAWSPDERWIATGDLRGATRVWDLSGATPACRHTLLGHNAVRALTFHPDSRRLAVVGEASDNALRIWDVIDGKRQTVVTDSATITFAIAYSPDGMMMATGLPDGTIQIWDVRDPARARLVRLLYGHEQEVRGFAFCTTQPDLLASTSNDQTVRLWDVNAGSEIARLDGHNLNLLVQFSASSGLLAVAGREFSIALWDITKSSNPQLVKSLRGHANDVLSVTFSPDGKRLVSGSIDRSVRLWDVASGEQISLIGHHDGYVMSVAYCPDGQRVASGGKDGELKIWHADSGQCLYRVRAPGPFEGCLIDGITGITDVQRAALKTLGAVEGAVESPVESPLG